MVQVHDDSSYAASVLPSTALLCITAVPTLKMHAWLCHKPTTAVVTSRHQHAHAQLTGKATLTSRVLPVEVSPQHAAPAQAACSQPAQQLPGTCQALEAPPGGFQQLAGAAMQAVRAAEWAVERAVRTSPSRWGQYPNNAPLPAKAEWCLYVMAHCKVCPVDTAAKKAVGCCAPVLGKAEPLGWW